MEPECPTDILVSASAMHLGAPLRAVQFGSAVFKFLCEWIHFQVFGGVKYEAQSVNAQLLSDAERGPVRKGALGSSWG